MAFRSSRYGWLILAGLLIIPVGITRYSDWKREQAEMERMKDPAYAEAKRKEEAEWKKTESAMKTLEAQRAGSASVGAVVVKPGVWLCGSTKDAYWEMTKAVFTPTRKMPQPRRWPR